MSDKTVKFPIGFKLFLLFTLILAVSLGLIIRLTNTYLQTSIKGDNFETNRRLAVSAESAFNNIQSVSRVLLQTINALGSGTFAALEAVDYFFSENPQILAVSYDIPSRGERLFVNKRSINEFYAASFFEDQKNAQKRSGQGETIVLNTAPFFSLSYLAIFFPLQSGGSAGVLFSSEFLNIDFNYGDNLSFMINRDGDILVYPDFSVMASAANVAHVEFIRSIRNRGDRSGQRIIETEFDFFRQKDAAYAAVSGAAQGKLPEKLKQFVYAVKQKIYPIFDRTAGDTFAASNTDGNADGERYILSFTKLNIAGAVVITCTEYKKGIDGLLETTKKNIYFAVAIYLISLLFVIIFSISISNPLKKLILLTNRFEKGEFNAGIRAAGNDEVAAVTRNFLRISSALQTFGKFSNRDIALKTMFGEIGAQGVKKQATVLFSNIHEFRAIEDHFNKLFGAEACEKIVPWLNNYYKRVIESVEKTDGVIDKLIGESVMAHWGAASTAGTPRKDAFNCVKAALVMRKAFFLMNKAHRVGDLENPMIQTGYGINSGSVTAGQLGSDTRAEYSVIGEQVEIASRIKELTKIFGVDILISEPTWRLAGDKFITEEMSPLTIEGREKPLRLFAVINFVNEPKGPQNIGELRRLLGVEAPEMELLTIDPLDSPIEDVEEL